MKKSEAFRTILINAAIELIDEFGGVRGVTLREVTKRAGCKHTNLYNYFDSFEDLLWASYAESIKRNMDFTDQRIISCDEPELFLERFTECQIEFALQHKGLFRFIWLETLKGQPSNEILETIRKADFLFNNFLKTITLKDAENVDYRRVAQILQGYMNGEIAKLINNRYFDKTVEVYCNEIVKNVITVFVKLKGE